MLSLLTLPSVSMAANNSSDPPSGMDLSQRVGMMETMFVTLSTKLDDVAAALSNIHRSSNTRGILGSGPRHDAEGTDSHIPKMRVDAPKFDGKDPHGWIFRVEEYFDIFDTPQPQRLRFVGVLLEGTASDWYRYMKRNNLLTDWAAFLEALKTRFDPNFYQSAVGSLSKLTQKTTVMSYQTEFEQLLTHVDGVREGDLIAMYVAGLRSPLDREVQLRAPTTLVQAFALAKEFEAVRSEYSSGNSSWGRRPSNNTRSQPAVQPTAGPTATTGTSKSIPIRKLTQAEKAERISKGLCYNCDETWSRTHEWVPKFLCLTIADDIDIDDSIEVEHEDIIAGDVSSLHSLASASSPRSLRLLGTICDVKVSILIDSGSSHNFIQPSVVEKLKLSIAPITPFRVYVRNGESLLCTHHCPAVPIIMQGSTFDIDLFVLKIHGPDVVLGIQWLQNLGTVAHDYAALRMEFKWHGNNIILQGEDTPLRVISFNQLTTIHDSSDYLEYYEIMMFASEVSTVSPAPLELPTDLPDDVLALLQKFSSIFQPPVGLPPRRFFDHGITLTPGVGPINVRPYRYPHYQNQR